MPPADVESSFGDAERELLRAWIEQGAAWDRHWAFEAPVRPETPAVESDTQIQIQQAYERSYEAGDVVFEEGAEGDSVFVGSRSWPTS